MQNLRGLEEDNLAVMMLYAISVGMQGISDDEK